MTELGSIVAAWASSEIKSERESGRGEWGGW